MVKRKELEEKIILKITKSVILMILFTSLFISCEYFLPTTTIHGTVTITRNGVPRNIENFPDQIDWYSSKDINHSRN